MASASPSLRRLTEQEYLALDRQNPFKSEFINGEMRAMAGGSLRHSALAMRCGIHLDEKLTGRGCTVFSSDARVRVPSTGSYVYPDASVVCGQVPDAVTIEHFSRQPDNSWIYRETKGLGAKVFLPALDITLSRETLYGSTMAIPG